MRSLVLAVMVALTPSALSGQEAAPKVRTGYATTVTPLFQQLLAVSQPLSWTLVSEQANETSYLRESVPSGQSGKAWQEMITVSAGRGVALNPAATAQTFANMIASGFQRACPQSFAGWQIPVKAVDGFETSAVLVACGRVSDHNGTRSETALIIAIKGSADMYTIQWAERAAARDGAPAPDFATWKDRYAALQPIRLCPRLAGEKAPYPSCASRRD